MGERGIVREFGMDMYTLLDLKWITNKDLLCSTGNSARGYVAIISSDGIVSKSSLSAQFISWAKVGGPKHSSEHGAPSQRTVSASFVWFRPLICLSI